MTSSTTSLPKSSQPSPSLFKALDSQKALKYKEINSEFKKYSQSKSRELHPLSIICSIALTIFSAYFIYSFQSKRYFNPDNFDSTLSHPLTPTLVFSSFILTTSVQIINIWFKNRTQHQIEKSKIEPGFEYAKTNKERVKCFSRIQSDDIIAGTASKMNFHQMYLFKEEIGPIRFCKIIRKMKCAGSPAVLAWKALIGLYENKEEESIYQFIETEKLALSKHFKIAFRSIAKEKNIPFLIRKVTANLPFKSHFQTEPKRVYKKLEENLSVFFKDAVQKQTVLKLLKNKSIIEDFRTLTNFILTSPEKLTLREYVTLVEVAHKWSQVKILETLDSYYLRQPLLDDNQAKKFNLIPELKNLKAAHGL